MAEDKKPMPADGAGTERREADDNGEVASRRDDQSTGSANAGESGGGAYPNPHDDSSETASCVREENPGAVRLSQCFCLTSSSCV